MYESGLSSHHALTYLVPVRSRSTAHTARCRPSHTSRMHAAAANDCGRNRHALKVWQPTYMRHLSTRTERRFGLPSMHTQPYVARTRQSFLILITKITANGILAYISLLFRVRLHSLHIVPWFVLLLNHVRRGRCSHSTPSPSQDDNFMVIPRVSYRAFGSFNCRRR